MWANRNNRTCGWSCKASIKSDHPHSDKTKLLTRGSVLFLRQLWWADVKVPRRSNLNQFLCHNNHRQIKINPLCAALEWNYLCFYEIFQSKCCKKTRKKSLWINEEEETREKTFYSFKWGRGFAFSIHINWGMKYLCGRVEGDSGHRGDEETGSTAAGAAAADANTREEPSIEILWICNSKYLSSFNKMYCMKSGWQILTPASLWRRRYTAQPPK